MLVACADIKPDGLATTLDLIAADGGAATGIAADVTTTADADRMVAETVAAFGRLDRALNTAGVRDGANPGRPVECAAGQALLSAPTMRQLMTAGSVCLPSMRQAS